MKNWSEFKKEINALPTTKDKGDRFESLVKYYLESDPVYMISLRRVWFLKDVPGEVRITLRLPDLDQGIDLVAETRDGKYWAIQCKYREEETQPLTWKDELSTFIGLTFGLCHNFAYGIIATTTDDVPKIIQKKDEERIGILNSVVWNGLDESFFGGFVGEVPPTIKPLSLREHQLDALKEAENHYSGNNRGKIVWACGTGKTLLSYHLVDRLHGNTAVIFEPSLNLVSQTLKVFMREAVAEGKNVRYLVIASDQTVGKVDSPSFTRSELAVPVTTDAKRVVDFLGEEHDGLTFVFSTYNSAPVLGRALSSTRTKVDIGIFDEAHKTVGHREKVFSHALFDQNVPIDKRVFLTATERFFADRAGQDEIVDMDDEEHYGKCFHQITFKEAIDRGLLSDYDILIVQVLDKEIDRLIQLNRLVKPKGDAIEAPEVEMRLVASYIAWQKAMRENSILKTISFHNSIDRAISFQQAVSRFGYLPGGFQAVTSLHVNGSMRVSYRERQMRSFRDSPHGLLTNARCLTEGIDIPLCDCILFCDPRQSQIDIAQAVGRAIRRAPGKDKGYVIVPQIIHSESRLDKEQYGYVVRVVTAIGSVDERIRVECRMISEGKTPSRRIIRITGAIPSFGMEESIFQTVDLQKIAQKIETGILPRIGRLEYRSFSAALEFVRSLHLRGKDEWEDYCAKKRSDLPQKPIDIPRAPNTVYAEWRGWGHWLGTGRVANQDRLYLPFEEAREFVRKLNLKGISDWRRYYKGNMPGKTPRPLGVPTAPNIVYAKSRWVSWGDWFGTGTISVSARKFWPFKKARLFVHNLHFISAAEWRRYANGLLPEIGRRPEEIPSSPERSYRNKGWKNFKDWIGAENVKARHGEWRDFGKARRFALSLKLGSTAEWRAFCKGELSHKGSKPEDIPSSPWKEYEGRGWLNMGDWLGTGTIAPRLRRYRSFEDARRFVRTLHLTSQSQWNKYCREGIRGKPKRPDDIPTNPAGKYKNKGWVGMSDWLGTGRPSPKNRQYREFKSARDFARSLGLQSQKEWYRYCKKRNESHKPVPVDIPQSPDRIYAAKGWESWPDWLGANRGPRGRHLPFIEARDFVQKLGLSSVSQWYRYCRGELAEKPKKPVLIPTNVEHVYARQGWKGWGDFLGTGAIATFKWKARPFVDAREFARSLQLKSGTEWSAFCKGLMPEKGEKPRDIPSTPSRTYKAKGWAGMGDWLGTGTIAPRLRVFREFHAARDFARSLNLKTAAEWRAYVKGQVSKLQPRPVDIPSEPWMTYKGKGWTSLSDWLGTSKESERRRRRRSTR